MTALAVVLAVVAAVLATRPRASLDRLAPVRPTRTHRSLRLPLLGAGAVGAVLLAGAVAGGRGLTIAACGVVLAATVGFVTVRALRERAATRRAREVAEACDLLSGLVRVGHIPAVALSRAAADCPVLRRAASVQAVGGDVVTALTEASAQAGCHGLRRVAQAWRVSERTGAPMTVTLSAVSRSLIEDQEIAGTVAGELSAPRATGRLLAALPLAGMGVGAVLGADPLGFMLTNVIGRVCLVAGVVLACAGVIWSDIVAAGVSRRPRMPAAGAPRA